MRKAARIDQIRAGVFVLLGVLLLGLSVYVLGKKSALFVPTDELFVTFRQVNGLVVGAPVRLAGLEIGSVTAISFPEDLGDKRARIRLVVRSQYMERIRADSRAVIDTNGLLGDKIINISLGDPSFPPLHDGSTLQAGETLSFEALATSLNEAIGTVTDGPIQGDLARISSSLANVLEEVQNGNGSLHQLIYDDRHAREFELTLIQARSLAARASLAMGRIDGVLAEVQEGDGGLHQMVYGPIAANVAGELATAAHEIGAVAREVRVGSGLAHTIIYDDDAANLVEQLEQLASSLNRIVADVERGRGTLGGLITDPTVYEDLKSVLGNVQRNVLFKALIRATIENDGLRRADQAPSVRPMAGTVRSRSP
jgi:phospholipid/cholesterol/gamma-HCH transport system substrate-binding protein